VFRKFAHLFVVIALVAVTGGHWALLQTVAWTNMLANNFSSGSFEDAITKTFDGRHPCGLCKAISSGKQSEKKNELPVPVRHLEFVSALPVFVITPPQEFCLVGGRAFAPTPFIAPPPVPPPRSLPG
jgi:hypothetical protein